MVKFTNDSEIQETYSFLEEYGQQEKELTRAMNIFNYLDKSYINSILYHEREKIINQIKFYKEKLINLLKTKIFPDYPELDFEIHFETTNDCDYRVLIENGKIINIDESGRDSRKEFHKKSCQESPTDDSRKDSREQSLIELYHDGTLVRYETSRFFYEDECQIKKLLEERLN